jgi:hypothetical protein
MYNYFLKKNYFLLFMPYMFYSESRHILYHPINLFILKFLHSFDIERFLFFCVFAFFLSQLMLRLLVLDTLNTVIQFLYLLYKHL